MDDAERALFAESLRRATEAHNADALDHALEELGWADALESDQRAAIATLFELQGGANSTSSALNWVVAGALAADGGNAVVLPAVGGSAAPATFVDGLLTIDGIATAAFQDRERVTVVAQAPGGEVVVVVPTAGLQARRVQGLDPWLGLVEVKGTVRGPEDGAGASDWAMTAPCDWGAAVALGRLAISHELVGAARQMLSLAREHALDRVQFGRPISSFQAVRHRLAETLVAIEAASAVIEMAWEEPSAQTAAMAKAMAGKGARTAARHAQQVLAGIGFTTEHPLHRYIRRALVLDQLFSPSRTLTRELGDELIRTRQLPPLQPL